MSYVDFQQAAGIAHEILNLGEYTPSTRFLFQGLNSGMIVAYCRPFSNNDRGIAGLERIPDLPTRFLSVLSAEEMTVHETVIRDRKKVLAHSDSDAWNPQLAIHRVNGVDMFVPMFNTAHAHLTTEATATLETMCGKLLTACMEARDRLEPQLTQYLPVLDYAALGWVEVSDSKHSVRDSCEPAA